MRLLRAVSFGLILAIASGASAQDPPERPPPLSSEQAIAVLRTYVEQVRGGLASKAVEIFDSRAIADRVFPTVLPAMSEAERAELYDIFRAGFERIFEPLPYWAEKGHDWPFDDFRTEPVEGGYVEVSARWKSPSMAEPARLGLVLSADGGRVRAVDLVNAAYGERWSSAVMAHDRSKFSKCTTCEFARAYLRVPIHGSEVPKDASVDWASPDVLAVPLQVPFVPVAVGDGWTSSELLRLVVQLESDGHVHWRCASGTKGSCCALRDGQLSSEASTSAVGARLREDAGFLISALLRIDAGAPWGTVRALVRGLLDSGTRSIAFGVRRNASGNAPDHGQVGLWLGGEAKVERRSEDVPGVDAVRVQVPYPGDQPPEGETLTVRVVRSVVASGSVGTSVQVADDAATRLETDAAPRSRDESLGRLGESVRARLAAMDTHRVRLELPTPQGDDVPFADFLAILLCLQNAAEASIDVAGLPFPTKAPYPSLPSDQPLTWTAPSGWVRSTEQGPMQLAAFVLDDAPDTRCSLSMLSGQGGGWQANLNRWRTQAGKAPLTVKEFAGLPRIQVLGVDAPMLSVGGTLPLRRGGSSDDALLVGVVCQLPESIVFVKMVGPRAEVESQRKKFVEFCESLRRR